MTKLLPRPEVARRLGLSERASYRVVPATGRTRLTRSDAFIRAVNACAVYGQPAYPEDGFPPYLDTPESLAYHFGVMPYTVRKWAKRPVNPVPHFHFGRSVIRFDRETVEQWTRGVANYTQKKA